ncbi:MAG TPA: Clp protease N-terminal domain-containing protein [Thermomicrobiaceae bacterium]|nr:Clp protease N-terminal domain-containing protein [Thermomicrobiaceae bacterium]
MPSSADRKRLEVPTHLHERLVEIAIDEDRTVASVVQEIITLGLSQYQSRLAPEAGAVRFTERAARALAFAREEAAPFNHNYLGTEHLLLGLLREGEGVAARVLDKFDVTLPALREYVGYHFGRGAGRASGSPGWVPRARRALALAAEEAERFGSHSVGTEHLLLGLTEVRDGMAARMLGSFGVLDEVRKETLRFILGDAGAGSPPPAPEPPAAAAPQPED